MDGQLGQVLGKSSSCRKGFLRIEMRGKSSNSGETFVVDIFMLLLVMKRKKMQDSSNIFFNILEQIKKKQRELSNARK